MPRNLLRVVDPGAHHSDQGMFRVGASEGRLSVVVSRYYPIDAETAEMVESGEMVDGVGTAVECYPSQLSETLRSLGVRDADAVADNALKALRRNHTHISGKVFVRKLD